MQLARSQIEQKLAHIHPNIKRQDINKCVQIILSEITAALCRDQAVEIRGVFRLSTKSKKSYIGRNPKSGIKIHIPAKRIVKFKASKTLLAQLNKNFTESKISDTY